VSINSLGVKLKFDISIELSTKKASQETEGLFLFRYVESLLS